MNTRDEDDAWRAIVENFGERAVLDDEPPTARTGHAEPSSAELDPDDIPIRDSSAPDAPADDGPTARHDVHGPFVPGPEHDHEPVRPSPSDPTSMHDDEGHFVPPTPPLPYVPPKRLVAWATLVLVPLVLILAALTSRPVSGTVATLLIAGWVGAFGYLMWTMPTDPRDPFDDGSRV